MIKLLERDMIKSKVITDRRGHKVHISRNTVMFEEWHKLYKPIAHDKVNGIGITIYDLGSRNDLPIFSGDWYHSEHLISLVNNKDAKPVPFHKLQEFLRKSNAYDAYLKKWSKGKCMCGDFAAEVHNHAEKVGIKSAYVEINYVKDKPHAINAFETTDRGIVFLDIKLPGICSYDYFFAKDVSKWDFNKDDVTSIPKSKKFNPDKIQHVVMKW